MTYFWTLTVFFFIKCLYLFANNSIRDYHLCPKCFIIKNGSNKLCVNGSGLLGNHFSNRANVAEQVYSKQL